MDTTLYASHILYPISHFQANHLLKIPGTILLSLSSGKRRVLSPDTSSPGQHRSVFLPDGDGSSSSVAGGCGDLYEPFTATCVPRVLRWRAVTTHTPTNETRPFYTFFNLYTSFPLNSPDQSSLRRVNCSQLCNFSWHYHRRYPALTTCPKRIPNFFLVSRKTYLCSSHARLLPDVTQQRSLLTQGWQQQYQWRK